MLIGVGAVGHGINEQIEILEFISCLCLQFHEFFQVFHIFPFRDMSRIFCFDKQKRMPPNPRKIQIESGSRIWGIRYVINQSGF